MTFSERLHLVNEKRLNILAVDIGNEGGMFANDFKYDSLSMARMPKTHRGQWLKFMENCPGVVVAENVHTFHKQGIKSNGTLMANRGRIEGFCAALDIRPQWIEPMAWIECYTIKRKKHFTTLTLWKKHLAEIARKLAPESLVNEIDLHTADAFLIWNYAASQQTAEPMRPMGFLL